MFEIKPHKWTEGDENCSAECYPFVNGKPVPELADCSHCEHYQGPEETCMAWFDRVRDAPLFCGPICPEFSNPIANAVLEAQDD